MVSFFATGVVHFTYSSPSSCSRWKLDRWVQPGGKAFKAAWWKDVLSFASAWRCNFLGPWLRFQLLIFYNNVIWVSAVANAFSMISVGTWTLALSLILIKNFVRKSDFVLLKSWKGFHSWKSLSWHLFSSRLHRFITPFDHFTTVT
jgi:hypothetical protein